MKIVSCALVIVIHSSRSRKMKSAALGLAEGSGAKLSHVLIETSPRQESEKTAFFLAWLGHCFKSSTGGIQTLCMRSRKINTWFHRTFPNTDWLVFTGRDNSVSTRYERNAKKLKKKWRSLKVSTMAERKTKLVGNKPCKNIKQIKTGNNQQQLRESAGRVGKEGGSGTLFCTFDNCKTRSFKQNKTKTAQGRSGALINIRW